MQFSSSQNLNRDIGTSMEQSIFAIEPEIISLPRQSLNFQTYVVIETLPNGDQRRHRMNEAGNPFSTYAEAQLWILDRKP